MHEQDQDKRIRIAAFRWLGSQRQIHGEVIPRDVLELGFMLDGQRVPIVGPSGIFKPALLPRMPLSITTIPGGPYDDDLRDGDSVIHYRYRGTDPNHRDNVGLRLAMTSQTPVVFCYRIMPSRYLVSYPVYICADRPESLTFDVLLDDDVALRRWQEGVGSVGTRPDDTPRRQYVTVVAKHRLHQAAFRERVISAYDSRCALCRLRHASLLDAAHIIPDGEPDGEPVVSNGLALCKIHHAAYDQNFLGIDADYKVQVKLALLDEIDGPMLQHGIKAMHGQKISVPSRPGSRPSKDLLDRRFARFRESCG